MPNFTRDVKQFKKRLIKRILTDLYLSGKLSLSDLKDKKKTFTTLVSFAKDPEVGGKEFGFMIDHRNSLLKEARIFAEKKDLYLARTFYAAYFEHAINSLIDEIAKIRKIDEEDKKAIIKRIDFLGKFTWLLSLLELPKFNKKHLSLLKKLGNQRNEFIHYKYISITEDELFSDYEASCINISSEVNDIEKCVTYFKRYESDVLFGKNKKKLEKILNELVSND